MEKVHELFTLSDIMGGTGGWFYKSDFGNLFYQLFRELPSVRMVKFKVSRSVKMKCVLYLVMMNVSIFWNIFIITALRMRLISMAMKLMTAEMCVNITTLLSYASAALCLASLMENAF